MPDTVSAKAYTTYRLEVPLHHPYFPQDEAALTHWLAQELSPLLRDGGDCQVLGWGSNSLLGQAGLPGPTLILRKLSGMVPVPDEPMCWHVLAGTHLAQVANTTVAAGQTGAEFFIGIPGTLGGALVMNAGAMGQETAPLVKRVHVYDRHTQRCGWLERDDLSFGYRRSSLAGGRYLILSAVLQLQAGSPAQAKERMAANVAFRKAHHPTEPNGGSVFRNPTPQQPVGRLVDELGGKGQWAYGGAMVSPLHGNFIINRGQATAYDIMQVMQQVQTRVYEAHGLWLHPETVVIGPLNDEETALWQRLTSPHPPC